MRICRHACIHTDRHERRRGLGHSKVPTWTRTEAPKKMACLRFDDYCLDDLESSTEKDNYRTDLAYLFFLPYLFFFAGRPDAFLLRCRSSSKFVASKIWSTSRFPVSARRSTNASGCIWRGSDPPAHLHPPIGGRPRRPPSSSLAHTRRSHGSWRSSAHAHTHTHKTDDPDDLTFCLGVPHIHTHTHKEKHRGTDKGTIKHGKSPHSTAQQPLLSGMASQSHYSTQFRSSDGTSTTQLVFEPFAVEVEKNQRERQQQQQQQRTTTPNTSASRDSSSQSRSNGLTNHIPNNNNTKTHIDNLDESLHKGGPVDLDDIFQAYTIDGVNNDGTLFTDDSSESYFDDDDDYDAAPRFFNNPNQRLLDHDASLIPGSPFSKPAVKFSNRPTQPLQIARYASMLTFFGTIGAIVFLFFTSIYTYGDNIARVIVECFLSLLSFFGIFWNMYFTVSSILKCFIPAKAFKTNTKYCSIIPEAKDPSSAWLDVTIQIPVYKESLIEVLMPTLQSCIASRDHYQKKTNARCNIVVCDDGMMAFLRDRFPAAEMLWNSIGQTYGRELNLGKVLKTMPRASRMHLKGLRSKHVHEVFYRMLYYYHYQIGFVARSTVDRRGKFKKASNLNSHLRLALGATQNFETKDGEITLEQALLEEVHNEDGSRFVMFGNDIQVGHLICINDADARMAETVIFKTVPEFLNDKSLGFTQHATKTMNEQRRESYFTKLLAVYTDSLYQGHFLLSSILGCHPPLVGHSIFLRTEAVKQCGRIRTLRKAQLWLERIGLHFLPVDQIGFANLQAQNRTEYWSESHVSEDFELMIDLYSIGFNGRYINYPDCEFQEGITRTFDEEAGRHRKFALGAHELIFNPFQDMLSHGIFTPVFRTFMTCEIPSYYKVFLSAYLCSYTSGSIYVIVFTISAVLRIFDADGAFNSISVFNPTGVIILNFVVYYIIGYISFLISMVRMNSINKNLLFPEYRKKWCGCCYLVVVNLRYCFTFQFLFYNVATFTFYFLGAMDHMLGRQSIVGTTNKDSIHISRCRAFLDTVSFNSGSWLVAIVLACLGYATVVQEFDWDILEYPDEKDEYLQHAFFAGPPILLALLAFIVPVIFNPFILGWPFLRRPKMKKKKKALPTKTVDLKTLMTMNEKDDLDNAIIQSKDDLDIEIGSITTQDLRTVAPSPLRNSKANINRLEAAVVAAKLHGAKNGNQGNLPSIQELNNAANAKRGRRSRDSSLEGRKGNRSRDSSLDRSYTSAGNVRAPQASPTSPHVTQNRTISWESPRSPGLSAHIRSNGTLAARQAHRSSDEARIARSKSPVVRRRSKSPAVRPRPRSKSPAVGLQSVKANHPRRDSSPGYRSSSQRKLSASATQDRWGFPVDKV